MTVRDSEEEGVNVKVIVRLRPPAPHETGLVPVQVNPATREVVVQSGVGRVKGDYSTKHYVFDGTCSQFTTQKELFDRHMSSIVDECLQGFNCTIFAYGQTGTGKTYTMEGELSASEPYDGLPPGAGVIPRSARMIFHALNERTSEWSVLVSYLEIYNEELIDLLASGEKHSLRIYDDGMSRGKGMAVDRLEWRAVKSLNDIFGIINTAVSKRRTAETLLNQNSSRSHSIFTITVHLKEGGMETDDVIKIGKLNLVDLAGSENVQRSGSSAFKDRAKEAGMINQSLLTLGRVINSLVDHASYVPYRDSKLTRLLQDSLGGRTKTCIIATIGPSLACLDETLSTLDYAFRAKNIRNKPEVNQRLSKRVLIQTLNEEIDRLRLELDATRKKEGVFLPYESFSELESKLTGQGSEIDVLQTEVTVRTAALEQAMSEATAMKTLLEKCERDSEETSRQLGQAREELVQRDARLELLQRNHLLVSGLLSNSKDVCTQNLSALSSTSDALTKCAGACQDALENRKALDRDQKLKESLWKQLEATFSAENGDEQRKFLDIRSGIEGLVADTSSLCEECAQSQEQIRGGLTSLLGQVVTGKEKVSTVLKRELLGFNDSVNAKTSETIAELQSAVAESADEVKQRLIGAQEELKGAIEAVSRADVDDDIQDWVSTCKADIEGQSDGIVQLNKTLMSLAATRPRQLEMLADLKAALEIGVNELQRSMSQRLQTKTQELLSELSRFSEEQEALQVAASRSLSSHILRYTDSVEAVLSMDYAAVSRGAQVVEEASSRVETMTHKVEKSSAKLLADVDTALQGVTSAVDASAARTSELRDSVVSAETATSERLLASVTQLAEFVLDGQYTAFSALGDALGTAHVDTCESIKEHSKSTSVAGEALLKGVAGVRTSSKNTLVKAEGQWLEGQAELFRRTWECLSSTGEEELDFRLSASARAVASPGCELSDDFDVQGLLKSGLRHYIKTGDTRALPSRMLEYLGQSYASLASLEDLQVVVRESFHCDQHSTFPTDVNSLLQTIADFTEIPRPPLRPSQVPDENAPRSQSVKRRLLLSPRTPRTPRTKTPKRNPDNERTPNRRLRTPSKQ
ncbi:MAG: uncharacterized protein KVP18_001979 [Porospora cf. gigantea A]|uniref:uncharacterized protein n=1 Tax=Porospora cf. gigantea A TaxID=2853593 RepID=UPI00355A8A70|nr:MAG: hypothetical protein KVP18_001979 [Porospora cf. gigantea A]